MPPPDEVGPVGPASEPALLSAAGRRLARRVARKERRLELRQGVVSSFGAGYVVLTTSTAQVKKLSSYSPTNGDTVWCLKSGSDQLCLGKIG